MIPAARSRWSFRLPLAALAAAALACAACAERITVPHAGPALHSVSGDSQLMGVPGRPFAPLVVQVADSTGTAPAGRLIVFAVERGSGRFAGESSVVVPTDSFGRAAATLTAGAADCWGNNYAGQLGTGDTVASRIPAPVAGGLHSCGIAADGRAWCWGLNTSGQLGTGGCTASATPIPPTAVAYDVTYQGIGAGYAYTCALATSGGVFCWGNGTSGQLGNGDANSWTPRLLGGGLVFDSLTVGSQHACGLTSAGTVYCWGANSVGQLGAGSPGAPSPAPVAVSGGLIFRSLSAGGLHTCGITTSGAAYCWGHGVYGAVGTGTTASASAPVAVSGGLTFAKLSAGGAHTCGVTTVGAVYCWGSRGSGRLGDGFADYAPSPQFVAGGLTFRSPHPIAR